MQPDTRNPLPTIPDGLDPWLKAWIAEAEGVAQVLRANAADVHAAAQEAVLRSFLEAAHTHYSEFINVDEAAALVGCCSETMRRKIRNGTVPDRRKNNKEHICVTRSEALAMMRPSMAYYNPMTDAQSLARKKQRPR